MGYIGGQVVVLLGRGVGDESPQFEGDRERMRNGIRSWVGTTAARAEGRLVGLEPTGLVALLCASAFGGTVAAAAGVGGAPGTAVAGGFTALGTGYLATLLSAKVEELRGRRNKPAFESEVMEDLAETVQSAIEGSDAAAAGLRIEIASVLQELGAVEAALTAAVFSTNAEIVSQLWQGFREMGGVFTEFGWITNELQRSTAAILRELNEQGVSQRLIIDRLGAVEDLLRERVGHQHWLTNLKSVSAGQIRIGPAVPISFPYRGLLAFREQDEAVFFGRDRLTAQLVSCLAKQLTGTGSVVVSGASGSGKSSLLSAGLLLPGPRCAGRPRFIRLATAGRDGYR